ncbi:hypothetical protein GPJ61_23860 [Brevibacillus formosus]|uniref:SUKH-4 family immunity protein n=1 Tax=Brevibacillus formosus TaxID=54913 RepID=UPI001CA48CC8|nr:SUKH-4 family immunity protein [Brevibacillus formosus]MBW5470855.1 hypothetical protein [Brevibacillus formosus]
MDFDIREIRDYYDSELRDYDYDELVRIGISHDNADFMVSIGVPEEYDDFVFYGKDTIQKTLIEGIKFIKIGHYACHGILNPNGLYLKEGSDGLFTTSSLHDPPIYLLNKNLRTFFLFHLIKNELAMKMRQEDEYSTQKYARELRRLYDQIDPIPMKDVEGYWSHLIEDYETGL